MRLFALILNNTACRCQRVLAHENVRGLCDRCLVFEANSETYNNLKS